MSRSLAVGRSRASDRQLRELLQRGFSDRLGPGAKVAQLVRRPYAYHTSFAIEELDVHLGDGTRVQLIFKDLSAHALLDGARRTRPAFLFDPARCFAVYERILEGADLGTAECLAAHCDARTGTFWLILEKVPGVELWQQGEREAWNDVARWLARLHARFIDSAKELRRRAPLLVYDDAFYRIWPRRAVDLLRARADMNPTDLRRFEHLASHYDRVVESLLALPATLLHGEFYPSNILVENQGTSRRICPIDWELAAVGPAVIDLAALTSGLWSAEDRRDMIAAYVAAWPGPDGPPGGSLGLEMALSLGRLHLAVQWLGWADQWTPPAAHAHDWLSEALQLADELKI